MAFGDSFRKVCLPDGYAEGRVRASEVGMRGNPRPPVLRCRAELDSERVAQFGIRKV